MYLFPTFMHVTVTTISNANNIAEVFAIVDLIFIVSYMHQSKKGEENYGLSYGLRGQFKSQHFIFRNYIPVKSN